MRIYILLNSVASYAVGTTEKSVLENDRPDSSMLKPGEKPSGTMLFALFCRFPSPANWTVVMFQ